MKIYILQNIADCGTEYLRARGYELMISESRDMADIVREVREFAPDGMIVRTAKITEEIMRAAGEQLKVIARHGAGTDNIDVAAAMRRGIVVCNGPHSNTEAVAQHIVMMVLACASGVLFLDQAVRSGNWELREKIRITELNSAVTAGFIGFGKIGRSAAEKLHCAFHVNILAWSRHLAQAEVPEYVTVAGSREEVLREADFLSLTCPLTAETRHMISAGELQSMKRSAFLINCGRGPLVDEEALYEAIVKKEIAGAALDTLEEEPVSRANPLLRRREILFTPHCAAHTEGAFERMAMDAATGADDVLQGRTPRWTVTA